MAYEAKESMSAKIAAMTRLVKTRDSRKLPVDSIMQCTANIRLWARWHRFKWSPSAASSPGFVSGASPKEAVLQTAGGWDFEFILFS
jgi:hypothetical protein